MNIYLMSSLRMQPNLSKSIYTLKLISWLHTKLAKIFAKYLFWILSKNPKFVKGLGNRYCFCLQTSLLNRAEDGRSSIHTWTTWLSVVGFQWRGFPLTDEDKLGFWAAGRRMSPPKGIIPMENNTSVLFMPYICQKVETNVWSCRT